MERHGQDIALCPTRDGIYVFDEHGHGDFK
jgi:hypothetical protein